METIVIVPSEIMIRDPIGAMGTTPISGLPKMPKTINVMAIVSADSPVEHKQATGPADSLSHIALDDDIQPLHLFSF